MAPDRSHQDSKLRAEEAFRLRATGRTWQEIADELGYKSHGAVQNAVTRLNRRTPYRAVESVRRSASEGLRIVRATLFEQFVLSRQNGDTKDLVSLACELRNNIAEDAKLHGAYAPVRSQVDINVHQSATAILDRAESELLALAERAERQHPPPANAVNPANVIDAEVVQ
ncbi:hypothetical protein MSIMFI_04908 [Mycobacterium simulans]|uniref:hypothetical protein n=1 Tax=Mycobacterium simulans TaxID=627089 RepID=UPI00174E133E|nr:hypothetical protein [Mycobacterium simulans]SON63378.1 hypothetical protein MSIMFI_04908 [Mycobacterium simulans]